jgi:hypothetical protein
MSEVKESLPRRLMVNYLVVFGLPTLVVLSGFYFGKNVLFSAHSAIGLMLLFLSLLIALGAQLIRIAGSPRKWLTAGDALVSIVAFALIFGVLYALMPNQWP